jgi:hypothetical protein
MAAQLDIPILFMLWVYPPSLDFFTSGVLCHDLDLIWYHMLDHMSDLLDLFACFLCLRFA